MSLRPTNMVMRHQNYINGEWKSAYPYYFPSINPAYATDIIGEFPKSSEKEINEAVAAAKEAYKKWRLVPAPERGEILFRAARLLELQKEDFAQLMTREMGKNLVESRGDVQEAIDMCKFIAGEGRRMHGVTTPSELPDKFCATVRMPIGVVAAITPWNFPIAIPSWKIAPALVCGNTVVFKPAEDTPVCAEVFVQILLEAGLDKYPGVLNMVHGYGEEAGAALVKHPDVRLVSFTGSSEVGRLIAMECASQHKLVSLELGGKNATIVMDDADFYLAIESCWWGAFGTCGQRCTASSRIIVHKAIQYEFTDRFVDRILRTRVGNGLAADVDIGPLINAKALAKVEACVEIARKEGAAILCGGRRLMEGDYALGNFFAPTVIFAQDPQMRINQEEIFGPVTSIIPANDLEHAIEIANSVNFGLSTAIITRDINKAFRAMRDLEAGITYVNSSTIGAEVHLPFGGVKQTGNGHREGLGVLDVFTEWKTLYVDYSGRLQKAQIDTNG